MAKTSRNFTALTRHQRCVNLVPQQLARNCVAVLQCILAPAFRGQLFQHRSNNVFASEEGKKVGMETGPASSRRLVAADVIAFI